MTVSVEKVKPWREPTTLRSTISGAKYCLKLSLIWLDLVVKLLGREV